MSVDEPLTLQPHRCGACGTLMPEAARSESSSTSGAEAASTPNSESESSTATDTEENLVPCPSRSCGVEHLVLEDGRLQLSTFVLDSHYSLCVLPFSLDEAEYRADPFRALEESPRWRRKTFDARNPDDADRTDYFLPYVRRFLFPSLYGNEAVTAEEPALDTCRHYELPLELLEAGAQHGVPYQLHCYDEVKDLDQTYPVRLDRVQIILFGYRVGFLVLRFRSASDSATLFEQMRALNYLRFVRELFRGFSMPLLTTATQSYRMPQLIAWLLADFQPAGGKVFNRPDDAPPELALPVQLFYDDRMLVYAFSSIRASSCLDDLEQNSRLLKRALVVRVDQDEQILGRKRTAELSAQEWNSRRWDSYSKDGGCLVVFDTSEFHRKFIGLYWETYYFDIFLLATLQRVTLLALFERMADIGGLTGGDAEGRKQLRRIRYDVLQFKNQCWFSQITNRELGLNLWRQWQKVFEVQSLLTEVNEQSEQLDHYLRNRLREQNERLIRLGTIVTTAAPVIWGLDVVLGDRPWVKPVKWALLTVLFASAGLAAAWILRRQKHVV